MATMKIITRKIYIMIDGNNLRYEVLGLDISNFIKKYLEKIYAMGLLASIKIDMIRSMMPKVNVET